MQAGGGLCLCVCYVVVRKREHRDRSHEEGMNCFAPVSVTWLET